MAKRLVGLINTNRYSLIKVGFILLLLLSLVRVFPATLTLRKITYFAMYAISLLFILYAIVTNIKFSKRICVVASFFFVFHTVSFMYGSCYISIEILLSWYIQGLLWIGMLFLTYKAMSCYFKIAYLRVFLWVACLLGVIHICLGFFLYGINNLQQFLSLEWFSRHSRIFVDRTSHYGFDKVGLSFFLSSCFLLTFPFQKRHEKFIIGTFVVLYSYLVGSKTSLLGIFAVSLIIFITRFKHAKIRKAIAHIVLLGLIIITCTTWPIINKYSISHGRYLGPVFTSLSYYAYPVGFGAGSYPEVAKNDLLKINLNDDHAGLLLRKVQSGKYDGNPYGLFHAAESNFLWFGVSYGWIFLAILTATILRIIYSGTIFWPMISNERKAAIMTIVYMAASGMTQDHIWSQSSWVIIAICITLIVRNRQVRTKSIIEK